MKLHLIRSAAIAAVLAALCLSTAIAGETRTWTNNEGRTLTAELLATDGENVTLKLENRSEFKIALSTLSDADRVYTSNWQKAKDEIANTPVPITAPLMTTPGKLIFASDLSAPDTEWSARVGDWKPADGVLSGTERAADDHAAVMKRALPLKNVIVEYDIMLGESKGTSFSMDDSVDHVCRVSISQSGFIAQKDDHDHEGPDVSKQFNRNSEELAADEWHTVHIEILGEEMLAIVGDDDDNISLGSDPLIATEKTKWGFTVAGSTVKFRNINIWEALPNEEWEKTGRRIKRKLDIED